GSNGLLRLNHDYRDITVDGAAWDGRGDHALTAGTHNIDFTYTPVARTSQAEHSINARTP
ncbi:MAG: hypothetical protein ACOH2M_15060, partial [Cypionkella sp.]